MLLLCGSKGLIGIRSSPNVPLSFDGFRHLMPDAPAADARKLDRLVLGESGHHGASRVTADAVPRAQEGAETAEPSRMIARPDIAYTCEPLDPRTAERSNLPHPPRPSEAHPSGRRG